MAAGRPTKYNPKKHPRAAYKLSLLGMTHEEMADILCIDISTLYDWKSKYHEFSEGLQGGGALADADIAASLYERAKGYSHDEEKVFCFQGEIIKETVTRHYPPDTGAAVHWLAIRQGKKWKNEDQSLQQKPVPVNVTIGVRDASKKDA